MDIEQVAEVFRTNMARLVAESAVRNRRRRPASVGHAPSHPIMETTVRLHVDEPGLGYQLRQLAWALGSDGIDGHEDSFRHVVSSAHAAGVSSVLIEILADPTQPEIARLRAFGRVAAALAASAPASRARVDATAA
jgi:hypothetical protein